MEKKSFRPKKPASPQYPVLREIDHATMSAWGLATLGGLLLGGAACTPARADLPPAAGTATTHDATIKHDKPRLMGKMAMPRADEVAPEEPASGSPPKPTPAPDPRRDGGVWVPPQPPRTGGVRMPQRIDPPAKTTTTTTTTTTSKTADTKKDSSAKSTKQKPHDGAGKDAASTPSKTKPERPP